MSEVPHRNHLGNDQGHTEQFTAEERRGSALAAQEQKSSSITFNEAVWPEEFGPADPSLPTIPPLTSSSLTTSDWSPAKQRERARSWIAMWLLGILTFIIFSAFVTIWVGNATTMATLRDLLTLIFAPVIGLVGAVTGFYYGEKSAESPSNSDGKM